MSTPRIDAAKLHRIGVLHEDDELLAVAKPAGMAVHTGAGETGANVIDLVRAAYPAPLDVQLVHRLDRGTSGVLLLAKSKEALRKATQAWPQGRKRYLTIARGSYGGPERIDRALKDEDGVLRKAVTLVQVRQALPALDPPCTLLEVELLSGRTHQIRRHLADLGHPLMLDDKYGDFAANKALVRALKAAGVRAPRKGELLLHASGLELPLGDRVLSLTAALPEVWREILAFGAPGERGVDGLAETS